MNKCSITSWKSMKYGSLLHSRLHRSKQSKYRKAYFKYLTYKKGLYSRLKRLQFESSSFFNLYISVLDVVPNFDMANSYILLFSSSTIFTTKYSFIILDSLLHIIKKVERLPILFCRDSCRALFAEHVLILFPSPKTFSVSVV